MRSDHSGEMIHMYSALVSQSRLPSLQLSHKGRVADISTVCWESFLPCGSNVQHVKQNLVVLVSRLLPQYFKDLSPLSKSVPQHIDYQYTEQMSRKSEVIVLDVL